MTVEKRIRDIDEMLQVQLMSMKADDAYMQGLYKGMEFVRSMIAGAEPVYMDANGKLDAEAQARCPERYI